MRLIPRRDRIIVEQFFPAEKSAGGVVLPAELREGQQYGKVVAAGPGVYTPSGQFVPVELKAGDEVVFSKYAGDEIEIEGHKFYVVRDDCILAVIDRTAEASESRR